MKKQEESPEEDLSEMKVSNLLEPKFKVMIIKMFNSMEKHIEIIKNNQS